MTVRWVDSHCHLEAGEAAERAVVEARSAGVARLVVVGTDHERSVEAIGIAREHPDVWATAGVHPHDATSGVEGVEALLAEPEVVAVGECGLDYHYDHSPRGTQRDVFAAQVALANDRETALVIHSREAWDDTFAVLRAEGIPERTIFHCFTGGVAEARVALDLGALLSFSGIVTFPSATEVREAAALCPSDRLLVETDSPYLTPVPHRGETNRPALVPVVGEAVAAARGVAAAVVAEATWEAAADVYRLGAPT